jgi:hypothetical protein
LGGGVVETPGDQVLSGAEVFNPSPAHPTTRGGGVGRGEGGVGRGEGELGEGRGI